MTVAAIVQARLGSTRLPAKVLLPLPTGRTVLAETLWRCKQIRGVDVVVAAIPDTAENDILLQRIPKWVEVVRGPEHDVLARYVKAAKAVRAETVVRITSDCPLIDPDVCGRVLEYHLNTLSGVTVNNEPRTWPHGYDCEVFPASWLEQTAADATDHYDREHVTPFLRRRFPVVNIASPVDRSQERLTLDTLDDYTHIWNIMREQMREAA